MTLSAKTAGRQPAMIAWSPILRAADLLYPSSLNHRQGPRFMLRGERKRS